MSGLRSERSILFSLWLIAVAKASSMMTTPNPDLWGHVLYGLEHLSSGSLPRTDPYSYTAYGAQWINHEWLSELLFGLGWEYAGTAGLWFLRLALAGATLAIVFRLITATTSGVWSGLLIYILAMFEVLRGFALRPQLFSYLFFACLLFLIHHAYFRRQAGSWLPLLLFAPIMGLWANLHGGFVMGIGLLGWLTLTTLLKWVLGRGTAKVFWMTLCGVSFACLATLLNPYGTGLWAWLTHSLLISRAELITEWFPALRVQPQSSLASFYATTTATALLFITTRERRSLFEWGLLAALCLLGFANNRNGIFFGIAAAIFLPRHFESLFPRLAAPRGFHRVFIRGVFMLAALYAVGINFFPGHRPDRLVVETRDHPLNTYRFIRHNGLEGNIAVYFDWAQSTIWYLGDTCRVAFDGRFRTVYPLRVEEDYVHFHRQDSQWKNLIDRYDTDMVLMPSPWQGTQRLLQSGEWTVASRPTGGGAGNGAEPSGENAVLLVRKGRFPGLEARLARGDLVPFGSQRQFLFGEPL